MLNWIFWSLFALDAAGLVYIGFLLPSKSGPEGPVGGWLIFIPPIIMAILAVVVMITRSDGARFMGISILAIPLIAMVIGPIYSRLQDRATDRRLAGDDSFRRPAQRKLAHAIHHHNAQLAKSLISGAGDINKVYGGETLLRFAVDNAHEFGKPGALPGGAEIVKALLDSGADPNIPASTSYPLTAALYGGSGLTQLLLTAGADPNRLDDARRPLWWTILSDDSDEGVKTLDVLLQHGADVKKRDAQGGPVAWASYHASMSFTSDWRLVWMLIEHGAEWKNEQEFGSSLANMLEHSIRYTESTHREISEAMRKIRDKLRESEE
jgi:hypothetical protein